MKQGFTLVDLIVALGVFAVVASIAAGGFALALRTQRQAASLIAANNNASLAIEQMAREMRTGRVFCDNRPQPDGGDTGTAGIPSCSAYLSGDRSKIGFIAATGETIEYRLASGGAIERGAGGVFVPITGGKVLVFDLKFDIRGNDENDGIQPRITIALGVSSREPGLSESKTRIQTTVSSRPPDR